MRNCKLEERKPPIYRCLMMLKPAPIPSLDWHSSVDGEEMFELANAAKVEPRCLLAAALDCASLCRNQVRKTRTALRALKAVEGFVAGTATELQMQEAVNANDAYVTQRHKPESFQSLADLAASCHPENMIAYAIQSLVYARYDPKKDHIPGNRLGPWSPQRCRSLVCGPWCR